MKVFVQADNVDGDITDQIVTDLSNSKYWKPLDQIGTFVVIP